MPSPTRPCRIGMIVPSSNTCLEPQTYRILGGRTDVTVHFTRIPVTRIALDNSSDRQFDPAVMREAAKLGFDAAFGPEDIGERPQGLRYGKLDRLPKLVDRIMAAN